MENLIWFVIMIPCSTLFTGIGIYAWNRKKPMWFWSGSVVKEEEITDLKAYNHANGVMWILFSLIFWCASFAGLWSGSMAASFLIGGCVLGIPCLVIAYQRIYAKYKR